MLVDAIPFHVGHNNLFSIHRTLGDDLAIRPANKTLAPKLNAVAVGRGFMPDTVCGCDVTTVRNRVTALNRFPSRILGRAEFLFFRRMPADGCWIKNDFRSP